MKKDQIVTPRWGWALTGSGHFFTECLEMIRTLDHVDLFVSKAAAEVVRMYKHDLNLPDTVRIFKDTTASAAPPSTRAASRRAACSATAAACRASVMAKLVTLPVHEGAP